MSTNNSQILSAKVVSSDSIPSDQGAINLALFDANGDPMDIGGGGGPINPQNINLVDYTTDGFTARPLEDGDSVQAALTLLEIRVKALEDAAE